MQGLETIIKQNEQAARAIQTAIGKRDRGEELTAGELALLGFEEFKESLRGASIRPPAEGGAPLPPVYSVRYGHVYKNGVFLRDATSWEIETGRFNGIGPR